MMNTGDDKIELPPGFRFHPTDEELITHYLCKKVNDSDFRAIAMGEADLNKSEPWDLPKNAKIGENEWYFFCLRDKKYPTGLRTNRATQSGYWKATGKDKEIYRGKFLVGMKKTLVFYRGRAPKGVKSNWVMHEYRLEGKLSLQNLPQSAKTEWVISRVFEKSYGVKKPHFSSLLSPIAYHSDSGQSGAALPPLSDPSTARLGHGHVPFFSSQDALINSFNNTTLLPTSITNNYPQINQGTLLHFAASVDQNLPSYNQNCHILQGQEHAVLSHLLASKGLSKRQLFKTEDLVMAPNADPGLGPGPSSSMGPVDLEYLWNY
ncbi:unnamed protein product [Rhodiola kirilowii]